MEEENEKLREKSKEEQSAANRLTHVIEVHTHALLASLPPCMPARRPPNQLTHTPNHTRQMTKTRAKNSEAEAAAQQKADKDALNKATAELRAAGEEACRSVDVDPGDARLVEMDGARVGCVWGMSVWVRPV